MYKVGIDRTNRRIQLTIAGFPEEDESNRIDADMRAAARELLKTGTSFDVIADLREARVLNSDSASELSKTMKWHLDNGLRRSANITPSALLRMQVGRMAADSRFACFDNEEDAIRWLES